MALLILDALGNKFKPILGDSPLALRLLEKSINPDFCFTAIIDDKLAGMLAFQLEKQQCLSLKLMDILKVYGLRKGTVAAFKLLFLHHSSEDNDLYVEAVAVADSARGQGVGNQLFKALEGFAREKSISSLSLDVIGTNPKAQALYERLGFAVTHKTGIWPLQSFIGWPFDTVFSMKKELEY